MCMYVLVLSVCVCILWFVFCSRCASKISWEGKIAKCSGHQVKKNCFALVGHCMYVSVLYVYDCIVCIVCISLY